LDLVSVAVWNYNGVYCYNCKMEVLHFHANGGRVALFATDSNPNFHTTYPNDRWAHGIGWCEVSQEGASPADNWGFCAPGCGRSRGVSGFLQMAAVRTFQSSNGTRCCSNYYEPITHFFAVNRNCATTDHEFCTGLATMPPLYVTIDAFDEQNGPSGVHTRMRASVTDEEDRQDAFLKRYNVEGYDSLTNSYPDVYGVVCSEGDKGANVWKRMNLTDQNGSKKRFHLHTG